MFVHVYGEERSGKRKLHSREKEGENPNQRLWGWKEELES